MSSSEDEMDVIPDPDIQEVITLDDHMLPLPPLRKSMERYMKTYENFMIWKNRQQDTSLSENVFLTYFNEISQKLEPSTLWGVFSMLKSTVIQHHDVNIKDYKRLTTLLKKLSLGYKSKKSKVFTSYHVETFLNEAPDYRYLATKVSMIFGVSGGCTGNELANLRVHDVEVHNKLLLIKIRDTRTMVERTFIVRGEYVDLIQKYLTLRPENVDTSRFFLNYQRGKCSKQVIGKNKFASMPKEIATYLKLPNPELYTGRCFRRTSIMLADCDLTALKRHAERCEVASAENGFPMTVPITEAVYLRPNDNSPLPTTSRGGVLTPSLDTLIEPKQEPVSSEQSSLEHQEFHDVRNGRECQNRQTTQRECQNRQTTQRECQNRQTTQRECQNRQTSQRECQNRQTTQRECQNRQTSQRECQNRQTTQPNQTNINIPDKTIALTFKNCSNVTKYHETLARSEGQGKQTSPEANNKVPQLTQTNLNMPGKTISLTFKNCSNFTINF